MEAAGFRDLARTFQLMAGHSVANVGIKHMHTGTVAPDTSESLRQHCCPDRCTQCAQIIIVIIIIIELEPHAMIAYAAAAVVVAIQACHHYQFQLY